MALTFNYAILRLVPDVRRGECVNVGIIIFQPQHLDVRILPSLNKAKALGGNIDLEQLYNLPESLNRLVQPLGFTSEAYGILKQFSGMVNLSELGWFAVEQPDQYEQHVEQIIDRLVKPPVRRIISGKQTRLQSEVKSMLKNQGILGNKEEDIHQHLVVPKFPIAKEENLYADFALKNSVFHITETIDFRGGIMLEKFREAALKAITLDKALRTFGNDTKRFVVYSATAKTESLILAHLNLVSDYSDYVLNIQSADDRTFYIDKIMEAASINQQLH